MKLALSINRSPLPVHGFSFCHMVYSTHFTYLNYIDHTHSLTRHHCIILDGPPYNHDGIVERSLRLFNKLLCSSSQDQCASLSLRATSEDVVSGEEGRISVCGKGSSQAVPNVVQGRQYHTLTHKMVLPCPCTVSWQRLFQDFIQEGHTIIAKFGGGGDLEINPTRD